MLLTDLRAGQTIRIGEAVVKLEEIKDVNGNLKARLGIEAPKHIKIQHDNSKKQSG